MWAGLALLEYRCAAKDWSGALEALDHMKARWRSLTIAASARSCSLTRAQALAEIDRDASRELVLESVKLAPDLVPAAALAGRRLSESGDVRKARKILEAAWAINPHPDIAESYANVRLGDSARERLRECKNSPRRFPASRGRAGGCSCSA